MKLLLSKRESNSPLYLKLACEELRMFGVFEKLNDHLRSLAQTVPQLVELMLQRIETENDKQLVMNAFALLYFSRQGIGIFLYFLYIYINEHKIAHFKLRG